MAYCVSSDLTSTRGLPKIVELTGGTGSTPVDAVVTLAIAKADSIIDTYVGRRYTVPLSPVPAVIKAISIDLAIHALYSRAPKSQATEDLQHLYDNAIGLLEKIGGGGLAIGLLIPAASVEYTEPYADAKFTMDDMERDGEDNTFTTGEL